MPDPDEERTTARVVRVEPANRPVALPNRWRVEAAYRVGVGVAEACDTGDRPGGRDPELVGVDAHDPVGVRPRDHRTHPRVEIVARIGGEFLDSRDADALRRERLGDGRALSIVTVEGYEEPIDPDREMVLDAGAQQGGFVRMKDDRGERRPAMRCGDGAERVHSGPMRRRAAESCGAGTPCSVRESDGDEPLAPAPFIVGAPPSGTTLFTDARSHPEITIRRRRNVLQTMT